MDGTTAIRVRTGLAVIQDEKILLVPHYGTDIAPIVWYLPGGGVEYGEALQDAARREFLEETGFEAQVEYLIDVHETIQPAKPWHSITFVYKGYITGGSLQAEALINHYGDKTPRWFSFAELSELCYHPAPAIKKAFMHARLA